MPLPQPRAAANIRGRAIALPYGPRRALRRSPVWPEAQNLFVGAGFIPPEGVRAAAGSGGMRASRPTNARAVAAVRFGRSFSLVCRGGPCPSRRPSGAAGFPGRCKHRPLHRLRRRGGSRFAAGFASPRRAGVHARRTAAIPKPECSPRRGVRRDEGIPPYGRPRCSCLPARPVIPGRFVGEWHAPSARTAAPGQNMASAPRSCWPIWPSRAIRSTGNITV